MVPANPASESSSSRDLQLQDLIFSCCVCQATVGEIYAAREHNKGFHSGSGEDDGVVTRLWIAECAHAFCGKHLDGGAAPFHPEGEQPIAPCPQCFREQGDDTPKRLFGIRGLTEGEHDPNIPADWFRCPPLNLDGTSPGMDAMRFQYMALACYAQKAHGRWRAAEKHRTLAEQVRSKERKHRKQLQAELKETEAKVTESSAAMENAETQLKKWRDRQPVINHYLGMVKMMADDMGQMRAQLVELGFVVPERDYSFSPGDGKAAHESPPHGRTGKPSAGALNSSLSTAVADRMELSSSSLGKRKRTDRQGDDVHYRLTHTQLQHRTISREMMPPPFFKPTRQKSQFQVRGPIVPPLGSVDHRTQHQVGPEEMGAADSGYTKAVRGSQEQARQRLQIHNTQSPFSQAQEADSGQQQQLWQGHQRAPDQIHHDFQSFRLDTAHHPMACDDHSERRPQYQEPRLVPRMSSTINNQYTEGQAFADSSHSAYAASPRIIQAELAHTREPLGRLHGSMSAMGQRVQPPGPREASRGQLSIATPYKRPGPSISSPFSYVRQYTPLARHSNPSQLPTAASRSRITLPPSTARTQDMELNSIPGLRGGSSQRDDGPYMQRGPGYQDPRTLFSAAGRRSVRR